MDLPFLSASQPKKWVWVINISIFVMPLSQGNSATLFAQQSTWTWLITWLIVLDEVLYRCLKAKECAKTEAFSLCYYASFCSHKSRNPPCQYILQKLPHLPHINEKCRFKYTKEIPDQLNYLWPEWNIIFLETALTKHAINPSDFHTF